MLVALFSYVLLLLSPGISAQRPSTASLCDYYAIQLLGANTTATQFTLIQNIVALAFAGGSGLANASSAITGIFNPGTVVNPNTGVTIPVDLLPWFNGSIDSTNVNNAPATVDWLDGGGKTPLFNYLTGAAPNISLVNTTNEYRLFNHWLGAFSHIFGCTQPTALPTSAGGQLNLAYVHKFMDLNQTDIGHFIDQLMLSANYWGFSGIDTTQLSAELNAQYNVRCSPPAGTQLYSLCQDDTCPLAVSPDCDAYVNLGPSGVISSATATATSAPFTPSAGSSTTSSTSSTVTASTTAASQSASATSLPAVHVQVLSAGGIAGVAIGGVAMILIFIAVLVWLLRKKRVTIDSFQPSPMNPSYVQPAFSDPHSSYTARSRNNVESWNGPPIAEMESPRFGSSSEMGQLR